MENQHMNLNIWENLPKQIWNKVPEIYEKMEGWMGFGTGAEGEIGIPYWFSFDESKKHITASVESAGLQFSGLMETEEWEQWKKELKSVATHILGFIVGEIELGEVGYDPEYITDEKD